MQSFANIRCQSFTQRRKGLCAKPQMLPLRLRIIGRPLREACIPGTPYYLQ